MLQVLRRCHALALALLLAAPGLGGTWLSVAHPCPVDTPWLTDAGHGGHEASGSHGHGGVPAESTTCHCVGACQGATVALTSISSPPTLIAVEAGWNTAPSAPDSDTPAQPRLRRHPPSTAPPLA